MATIATTDPGRLEYLTAIANEEMSWSVWFGITLTLTKEEIDWVIAESEKGAYPKPRYKATPTPGVKKTPAQIAEEAKKAAEAKKAEEAKRAEEVKKVAPPAVPPQVITRPAPELIIKRTPYPKWWNDEGIAKISLTSPGSQLVITARGDYSLYIATIVLTVSGECDIAFTFGQAGASGTMNFGGTDEPRGIVIATGNSPTPCGSGSFMITANSDEAVTIGGYVSYYLWKKEPG